MALHPRRLLEPGEHVTLLQAWVNRVREHDKRALEYFTSVVMLIWCIVLALPGDTFQQAGYAAFLHHNLTEEQFAAGFGIVGGSRFATLLINGRWPQGPAVRVLGAMAGFLFWSNISIMLYESTKAVTSVWTTGCPVYAAFAIAEILAVFRAMYDARYNSR